MKLIQALKKVKDLERKLSDLEELVKDNCALSSLDTPKYPDQKTQIDKWIQQHKDILQEILNLRLAIQKTNLSTDVEIEVATGLKLTKSIAAWIHRRRDLARKELTMWQKLTDRGIKEGLGTAPGGSPLEIKVSRFYEPSKRDQKLLDLKSEPSIIDAHLEIINAVTDLIEG